MAREDHNIVKKQIPAGWGLDEIDICADCGAQSFALDEQSCKVKKADLRPSGFGQSGKQNRLLSSGNGW